MTTETAPEGQEQSTTDPTPPTTDNPPGATIDPAAAQALQDRLDRLERDRPPSLRDQLAELTGVRDDARDQRDTAKQVARDTDDRIAKLEEQLRRSEIKSQAVELGFGDHAEFVTDLAAGHADPSTALQNLAAMVPPSTSRSAVGSGQGQADHTPDAIDRLAAQFDSQNGR